MPVDLTRTRATARRVAADWGLDPGKPFALAHHSYAAPVGEDAVLKVGWEGDDEALHDADAFELWGGNGAVRLLRRDDARRATLLERARPGTDLSGVDEDEATAVAVDVATRLWHPAGPPFRPVDPSDREYDVAAFLWNPMTNRLDDPGRTERRIEAFVAAGLDGRRIRAWTVIRGAYLRSDPAWAPRLRAVLR